jgi:hypothetical protein
MHPFAWGQRVAASIAARTSITHPVPLFPLGRSARRLASPTTRGSLWKLDLAKSLRDSILRQLAIFTFRSASCSTLAKAATEAADAPVQLFQFLSTCVSNRCRANSSWINTVPIGIGVVFRIKKAVIAQ